MEEDRGILPSATQASSEPRLAENETNLVHSDITEPLVPGDASTGCNQGLNHFGGQIGMLPRSITRRKDLSPSDKLVMTLLLEWQTENEPPRFENIGDILGLSDTQTKRSLKSLSDRGIIVYRRTKNHFIFVVNWNECSGSWFKVAIKGAQNEPKLDLPTSVLVSTPSLTAGKGTEGTTEPIGVEVKKSKMSKHSWSGWTDDQFPEWARDTLLHWESVAPLPRKTKHTDCLGAIYDLEHLDKFTPVEILRTCAYIACCMAPAFINSPLKLRKKTSDGTCQTFERYKQMFEAKEKEFGGRLIAGWPEMQHRHHEIDEKYRSGEVQTWAEQEEERDRRLGRKPPRAEYVPTAPAPVPIVEPAPAYTVEQIDAAKAQYGKFIRGSFGTLSLSERERRQQVERRNAMLEERGADLEGIPGYDEDAVPEGEYNPNG